VQPVAFAAGGVSGGVVVMLVLVVLLPGAGVVVAFVPGVVVVFVPGASVLPGVCVSGGAVVVSLLDPCD